MKPLDREIVNQFVNEEIVLFHDARLAALERIALYDVLKKKNPYLFRAKNILVAGELIASMLDALLSSSEEKIFGDFLERLAIFVSEQTSGGRKSSATGIDLEFEHEDVLYLVSIKSGPNWGNSAQCQSLRENFRKAIIIQKQAHPRFRIQPVLGICYGKTRTTDSGHYLKITGQNFWHFVSGDPELYIDIIEPIGHRAKQHNERFLARKAALHNRLTQQFIGDFCEPDGRIDWPSLVKFNSGNLK